MSTAARSSLFELAQSASSASQLPECADYGFISLLGLAQRLGVDFLQLTWQAALGSLDEDGKGRRGGQAKVFQLYADPQTSLAFKQFRCNSLDEITRELLVLTDKAIRGHPYIARLEGLCWDVQDDNDVRPVLIFGKSHFGDLYHFMTSGLGWELSVDDRLRLCVDIGIALRDMHTNKIIHGDIKPRNVLVFREESLKYVVKVADFGFSTRFREEKDLIQMPKSPIWHAPEWHDGQFQPEAAKRMDIFSFGLVCLWMLFGVGLSLTPMKVDERFISFDENYSGTQNLLKEWKAVCERDELVTWAISLIPKDLEPKWRSNLTSFFESTVTFDPQRRDLDVRRLLHLLAPARNLPEINTLAPETVQVEEDFKISTSFSQLYFTDFRVPSFIVASLKHISQQTVDIFHRISPKKAALQLAFCHATGFGVPRNIELASKVLLQHAISLEDLMAQLRTISKDDESLRNDYILDLGRRGILGRTYLPQYYRDHFIMERAESACERDVQATQDIFGPEHPIHADKKAELADLVKSQGRWKEAEKLELQIIEIRKKILQKDDPDTLTSTAALASTYRSQGRWKEAEELEIQILETNKRIFGEEHRSTLGSKNELALTFSEQGRWEKAEELQIQIVKTMKRKFGSDHPATLMSEANLASTYGSQGQWKKAEKVMMQITETRKKVLGKDHPDTLTSISDLAAMYRNQGRLTKAEELGRKVLETTEGVLGEEHPDTISSILGLAMILIKQERWEEAEQRAIKAIELGDKVLGEEHPKTLSCRVCLASIHESQGQFETAETLQVKLKEITKQALGEGHPLTLNNMFDLASTCRKQKKWEKAEKLLMQTTEMAKKMFGEAHPNTLRGMSTLALIYRDQERWKESEELYIQTIESMKTSIGVEHPDTQISVINLAELYWKQGRLDEAAELEMQALEIMKSVYGEEHPQTLIGMANLAVTWKEQGRDLEALHLLKECMQLQIRVLGFNDPRTLASFMKWIEWQQTEDPVVDASIAEDASS